MTVSFFVPGTPAPQGSKRAFRNKHTGRIQQVESSQKVAPWRADVRAGATEAVLAADGYAEWLWESPVSVELVFFLPRPKGHYGTGRNAGTLKDSAPLYPSGRPDVDKLARACLDALTSIVFADDNQVVRLVAEKFYADHGDQPGVDVTVEVAP